MIISGPMLQLLAHRQIIPLLFLFLSNNNAQLFTPCKSRRIIICVLKMSMFHFALCSKQHVALNFVTSATGKFTLFAAFCSVWAFIFSKAKYIDDNKIIRCVCL